MLIIDTKELDKIVTDFDKYVNLNARVSRTALNLASRKAKKDSLALTRGEWDGLKVKDFKGINDLKPAKNNDLTTIFSIDSRPINLAHFHHKEIKSGVSYRLKGSRKKLKPHSFKAKGFIFRRMSTDRDDITPYFSITPTSMFEASDGVEKYIEVATTKFESEYLRTIASTFNFAKFKKKY